MSFLEKINSVAAKINPNTIIAVSALMISVLALVISIQEVRIMRSQQKASMYPYLTIGRAYNSSGFGVEVKNSGNGIAKINSYQVYNDSIYFKDWFDLITKLCPDCEGIDYGIAGSTNIQNQMITPGEEVRLFFVKWTEETRKLERKISDFTVRVCYSSLLDDHWKVEGEGPIQLEKPCEVIVDREFELN